MFYRLLLLFTVVPFVELIVLLEVGKRIGVLATLGIIVLTGILGAALARIQGFIVLTRIKNELNTGNLPADALIDGLLILIGAIVLLTPGFITDAIGFLLLIPITRNALRKPIRKYFRKKITDKTRFYSSSQDFREEDKFNL